MPTKTPRENDLLFQLTRKDEQIASLILMAQEQALALTAAQASLEEAKKDAERYRFLRNKAKRTQFGNKHYAGDIQVFQWEDRTTANIMSGDALDAAIDAARQGEVDD